MGILKKINNKLKSVLPVSLEQEGYTNKKQILKELSDMLGDDKSEWGRIYGMQYKYSKWYVDRYPLDYKTNLSLVDYDEC